MSPEERFRPATYTTTPGDVTARVWTVANLAYLRDHPPTRTTR